MLPTLPFCSPPVLSPFCTSPHLSPACRPPPPNGFFRRLACRSLLFGACCSLLAVRCLLLCGRRPHHQPAGVPRVPRGEEQDEVSRAAEGAGRPDTALPLPPHGRRVGEGGRSVAGGWRRRHCLQRSLARLAPPPRRRVRVGAPFGSGCLRCLHPPPATAATKPHEKRHGLHFSTVC